MRSSRYTFRVAKIDIFLELQGFTFCILLGSCLNFCYVYLEHWLSKYYLLILYMREETVNCLTHVITKQIGDLL
uniref:Pco151371 n=1 Tax=Arundo donax TaxID=35708 RepID=A0A0A9DM01_ARUDO